MKLDDVPVDSLTVDPANVRLHGERRRSEMDAVTVLWLLREELDEIPAQYVCELRDVIRMARNRINAASGIFYRNPRRERDGKVAEEIIRAAALLIKGLVGANVDVPESRNRTWSQAEAQGKFQYGLYSVDEWRTETGIGDNPMVKVAPERLARAREVLWKRAAPMLEVATFRGIDIEEFDREDLVLMLSLQIQTVLREAEERRRRIERIGGRTRTATKVPIAALIAVLMLLFMALLSL